eukprot:jgi/Botrbrau1/14696/Bobra.0108s0050.1
MSASERFVNPDSTWPGFEQCGSRRRMKVISRKHEVFVNIPSSLIILRVHVLSPPPPGPQKNSGWRSSVYRVSASVCVHGPWLPHTSM